MWPRILSITALLSVVLFKFQNCAPTNPSQQFASENAGEVRIIDRWDTSAKIEFMSPSYLVDNSVQSIVVQGLCVGAERGQLLSWQLEDEVNQIVDSGIAECNMGGFQLDVRPLPSQECDRRYQLKAHKENSEDEPAVTELRPFC